jgi:hypothetical protein
MQYPSEKGKLTGLIFLGLGLYFFGMVLARIMPLFRRGDFLVFLFLIPLLFVIWIWFRTRYEIRDGFLHYQSGPLFGKIDIQKIKKLEVGKTLRVGYRPALAPNGIIIHYQYFNEIYFSPTNQTGFIRELLNLNSNIQVINHSTPGIPTNPS